MECQVKEPFESSQIGYKSKRQGNKHAMSWQHFVIRNKKQFAEDKTLSQFSSSSRSSTSRSSTPSLCLCYIKCQLIWCTSMQTYIRANICLNLWWFNEWGFVERLKIYIILRLAKKNLILGVDKLINLNDQEGTLRYWPQRVTTWNCPWNAIHPSTNHESQEQLQSVLDQVHTVWNCPFERQWQRQKQRQRQWWRQRQRQRHQQRQVTSHDCCHHWS